MELFLKETTQNYIKNIKLILDNIATDYNIDKNELYKYLENKKKNNDIPNSCNNLCMARKQDGNQCTRKKKYNDYCGKHVNNQKHGRIDDCDNLVEDLSQDENYIMVWKENYENKEYLIDSNNIVYTNNVDNPQIIGKKINNLIKFI